METDQSGYQTPVNVGSVATFDLQQLEGSRTNNLLEGNLQLSPYFAGGDADANMLSGDIGSHDPSKDEEDALLEGFRMAANTASGIRAIEYMDQSKAPGNNRPASGRP